MKGKIAQPELRASFLVRDKEGRPKFDDPSRIKNYVNALTDEDKDYLVQLFNVKTFEDFLKE